VPAVGDLDRLRGSLARPVGIGPAAVATDDLATGMRPQPRREGLRRAVGEQINGAVPFEIDDDAAVASPPASAPVVDANDARRRRLHGRVGVNQPQQRHAAHADALVMRQPYARFPAKRVDDAPERRAHVGRPPPVDGDERGQPLAEDLARTRCDGAGEAPRLDAQGHRQAAPRQVRHRPRVRRMHGRGALLAERAGGRGPDGRDGERDAALGDLNVIEAQPFKGGARRWRG